MKERIIIGVVIFVLLCTIIAVVVNSAMIVSGSQADEYTEEELVQLIADAQFIKDNAHTMAESARALGWTDDDDLIIELKEKWHLADKDEVKYQELLDVCQAQPKEEVVEVPVPTQLPIQEINWAAKEAEYPHATYIWRYMKAQGWNDYVCAGVMGNLMAEVGGQTLDIRYTLSSSGYYGMCQWNRAYSEVWGAGLETQCNFLGDTIKYEFDTYGFNYQKGFNFNSFLNMNDAQQAALAFAKSYERCSSASYNVRMDNAVKAYNYFVD